MSLFRTPTRRVLAAAAVALGLLGAAPALATNYHVDFSDLTVGDTLAPTLTYPGVTISGGFAFLVDPGPAVCAYVFSSCDGQIVLDFASPATNIHFDTLYDWIGYSGVSYGYMYQGSQFGGFSPVDGVGATVDHHDLSGLPPITRLLLSFEGVGLGIDFSNLSFELDGAPLPTSAVPEPATWLSLILGFSAIGGALRARRRRTERGTGTIYRAPARHDA